MSRRQRIVRAGGIFACSIFALLLWSKLKLVSGIPRTAYATPEADRPGSEKAGSLAGPGDPSPLPDQTPGVDRHAVVPSDGLPRP